MAVVTVRQPDEGDFVPPGGDDPVDADIVDPAIVDIDVTIKTDESGKRFDHVVSERLPEYSRNTINQMIRQGWIKLNNSVKKPGHRIQNQDHITGNVPAAHTPEPAIPLPEPLDLDILYDDASLIVINKPSGLVVHPAPGHRIGTLVHGLLYYFPEIVNVGSPERPGIVHRIDKGTSGLLIVAKTQKAWSQLVKLFKSRKIEKTYLAFAYGNLSNDDGQVTYRISRHKKDRKKMAASRDRTVGRNADTVWQVIKRFEQISLLQLQIKTGRTHQIRVHCASIGHPLVGDATYGYKNPLRAMKFNPETAALLKRVNRPMLHAWKISLPHPVTGIKICFEAPLPEDMAQFHAHLNAM